MRRATIEQKASDLLNEYNMMSAPVPIKELIKKLNIKLESFNLGEDISGVLVFDKDNLKIGYNPSEPVVRQRFTLAHEVGHYVLHCGSNRDRLFVDNTKVMFRRQNVSLKEKNEEMQANAFSAALLMPKELINKEYEKIIEENDFLSDDQIIKRLSSIFKVSEIAMTYRLTNLDLYF